MTILSDNHTDYGIQTKGEKYFWISYLLIVLLSSLIGDSIILVASIKHNAIKLNKIIVVVMQHIAVCDLLASLSFVLPTLISLISEQWILGETLAYIMLYLDVTTFQAANILICVLSTGKFLLLRYPLQTRQWTVKGTHTVCGVVWVFVNVFPVLRLIFDTDGLVFSHTTYNINYGLSSRSTSTVKVITIVATVLTLDIPTVAVMVALFCTLMYLIKSRRIAYRSRGQRRWQGFVTVVATVTVYCISVIPSSVVPYVAMSDSDKSHFVRIAEFLIALNIMSNFYIYSLTIPSFRKFIRSKSSEISGSVTQFFSTTHEGDAGNSNMDSVFTSIAAENLREEPSVAVVREEHSQQFMVHETNV